MADELVQVGVGSYDWNGGTAPAGGTHTGQCTITMVDGTTFVVAHNVAEAQRKIALGSEPSNPGGWVAFDQPNLSVPLVLNADQIASAN